MAKHFQVDTGGTLLTSLIAYWKLEDAVEYYVGDGSYDLTNNNSVAFAAGLVNNAADFGTANTNKSLDKLSDGGITGGAMSWSCWVKLRTEISTGLYAFVEQIDGGTSVGQKIRYYYNSGSPLLQFIRVKKNTGEQSTNYQVSLGTSGWHHIVYTYDGTNIRGYLDGSLVAGPTAASGSGSGSYDALIIGAEDSGGGSFGVNDFASAYIDEVGLWSKALSQTEVTDLYNSGAGQTIVDATNYTSTLDETPVSLTESVVKAIGRSLTETTVSLTESLTKDITRILTETEVALTEAFEALKIIVVSFTETTVTTSETIIKGAGKVFTESTVNLTSSISNAYTRILTETPVILTEVFSTVKGYFRTLTESTVNLTESLTKDITRILTETTVSLTSTISIAHGYVLAFTETTVALTSTIVKAITKTFTETVTLTSSLVKFFNGLRVSIWTKVQKTTATWTKQGRPD